MMQPLCSGSRACQPDNPIGDQYPGDYNVQVLRVAFSWNNAWHNASTASPLHQDLVQIHAVAL